MKRADALYAARYCEENIWHLCVHSAVKGSHRFVVIFSVDGAFFPIWRQRPAERSEDPVWWDYHVVLVTGDDYDAWRVWDLDSTLEFPSDLNTYVSASFPLNDHLDAELRPRARVIEAAVYRSTFSSDRRHMFDGDQWLAPPPPWPAICIDGAHTLDPFIDPAATGPGIVVPIADLPSVMISLT